MQSKHIIWILVLIGGSIGGYIPVLLLSAPSFSFSTLIGNSLGAFVGIYLGFKLTR